MSLNECIFCKILNSELEGSFVYRGNLVSAFMDINPINQGHVLVVPNNHHERFTQVEPEVAKEMFYTGQAILRAIQESKIKCEGANIFLSDGVCTGQEVPHSHLHIAPRFNHDGHRMGFSHVDALEKNREQLMITAKLISDELRISHK